METRNLIFNCHWRPPSQQKRSGGVVSVLTLAPSSMGGSQINDDNCGYLEHKGERHDGHMPPQPRTLQGPSAQLHPAGQVPFSNCALHNDAGASVGPCR